MKKTTSYPIMNIGTCGQIVQTKVTFMMEQMLNDLIYLTETALDESHNPIQLRFAKDPP